MSLAWKPAISIPVNSRMPPRKARLLIWMSGTSAPGENGICDGLPCSRTTLFVASAGSAAKSA